MSTPTPEMSTVAASPQDFPLSSLLPEVAHVEEFVASPLPNTIVLMASPNRSELQSRTIGLLALGVGQVLQAQSVAQIEEILSDAVVGDLALISVAFGDSAEGLIRSLCTVGWARVIALAPTSDASTVAALLHAGATGFLLRDRPWLADAPPVPVIAGDLSAREVDVIRLVAKGHSNRRVAQELLLASSTVKSHLARIGRKLGAGDRAHIVVVALRAGIID